MSTQNNENRNDTTVLTKDTEKIAKYLKKSETSQTPAGDTDVPYLAKSITIREDQYMDITSLAAYNKLLRKKPDTVSAVVREALDHYLSITDDSYRSFAPHARRD